MPYDHRSPRPDRRPVRHGCSRRARAAPPPSPMRPAATVTVPERVTRVFPAGPPAAILLYTLGARSPARLAARQPAGGVRIPAARHLRRPEVGRLTGRGNTANLEAVLALKPDLILDVGYVSDTYVSLAERVQEQTGIPYALLDGHFDADRADLPHARRADRPRRGRRRRCARYADDTMKTITGRIAADAERASGRASTTRAGRAGSRPGSAARSMSRPSSSSAPATSPPSATAGSPLFRSSRCCCGIPTSSSPSIRISPRTCATIRPGRRSRRCAPAACTCRPSCRSAGSIFRPRSTA